MKKVTDLKENEVIHCTTEQEALQICDLMHEAGLKWGSGASWAEHNDFYYLKNEICYNPKKGQRIRLKEANAEKYKIYPASDFLMLTYTVTREMLKDIANQNEHLTYECERFISSKFDIFTSSVYFNTTDIESYYDEAEDNRNEDEHQLLALLFPNYEKPKQKKEITVWVNVYQDEDKNDVFTESKTAKEHLNESGKTVEGKLTYEI